MKHIDDFLRGNPSGYEVMYAVYRIEGCVPVRCRIIGKEREMVVVAFRRDDEPCLVSVDDLYSEA